MTALPVPRPEDVYDAETLAGFRAAGYWRDETLSASVDRLAGQDRVLLTDGYGALTGAQLREQAYRLAAALRWLGVEAGDRVQVQLPNWNEFVVVYVAMARIGAVLVPTMPSYRHDEVLYVLQHSGAKMSVVAGEFRGFDYPGMLADIRASVPRCALLPVYGRSEGLLVTACTTSDSAEHVLSSDGRAFLGVVLEITDEDGKPVPAGTEGEICHGGPGLMLGYWRDPELTAASIDDRGVSRSGDLGRVDEDGYLRVTGRIKDMIIRGGLNISAAEVENHPGPRPPDVARGGGICSRPILLCNGVSGRVTGWTRDSRRGKAALRLWRARPQLRVNPSLYEATFPLGVLNTFG